MRAAPLLFLLAGCTLYLGGDDSSGAPDAAVAGCPGLQECGIGDLGWYVYCRSSRIYVDDLTTIYYCAPGHDLEDYACATGGVGDPFQVDTCLAGCGDETYHWFETYDDYRAFEPTGLCAHIADAGPLPDAVPEFDAAPR